MNFIEALKREQNLVRTENGALSYASSMSGILDLFGLGAAYRTRSEDDCKRLFIKAWAEDPDLALKCLFYIRDVRGGQGERRFFRVILHDLAIASPEVVRHNLEYIPYFGRWDDLYCLVDTPVKAAVFALISQQLRHDMTNDVPSLLAKWLKSENTSSQESRRLATITRNELGLSAKQYRKMLSKLRKKISIVESQMSKNEWEKIQYGKLPSRAGFIYRKAFERHDEERYNEFINDKETKVNATTLYPYEMVKEVFRRGGYNADSQALDKYWDSYLKSIDATGINGNSFIVVADTSGSMEVPGYTPISAAISLAMIGAHICKDAYHNHFITFSTNPELQEIKGNSFVRQVINIYNSDWGWNTDVKKVFDLILHTAIHNNIPSNEMMKSIILVSDMEFDMGVRNTNLTLFETIERKYAAAGYKMPNLVFWNVNARHDLVPMQVKDGVTLVSGFSPSIFESIVKGKSAWNLVLDKLLSDRYKMIRA